MIASIRATLFGPPHTAPFAPADPAASRKPTGLDHPSDDLATPTSDLSVEQLREGIHSLPQELYDQIYALTFTPDDSVVLNAVRKSPVQLQINSQTRQDFITSYYGATAWLVTGFDGTAANYSRTVGKIISDWLYSLPKDALSTLVEKERTDYEAQPTHRARTDRNFFAQFRMLPGTGEDYCAFLSAVKGPPYDCFEVRVGEEGLTLLCPQHLGGGA